MMSSSWFTDAQRVLFGLETWEYQVPLRLPATRVEQALEIAEASPRPWLAMFRSSVPLVVRRDRSGARYLRTEPVTLTSGFVSGFGDRGYLAVRATAPDECAVHVHQQPRTYQRTFMTVWLLVTWSIVVGSLLTAVVHHGPLAALLTLLFPLAGRGLMVGMGRRRDRRQTVAWLRALDSGPGNV